MSKLLGAPGVGSSEHFNLHITGALTVTSLGRSSGRVKARYGQMGEALNSKYLWPLLGGSGLAPTMPDSQRIPE